MALDKCRLAKVMKPSCLVTRANEGLLADGAGFCDSRRFPVKVTGGRPNDGAYWVSVSHSIIEPLDVEHIDGFAASIAIDVGVKRSTRPIRTENPLLSQGLCILYNLVVICMSKYKCRLREGLMIRLAPPTIADVISPACNALQAMSRHVRDDEHAVLSVMLRLVSVTVYISKTPALDGLARTETGAYSPRTLEVILIRHPIRKQVIPVAGDSTAG